MIVLTANKPWTASSDLAWCSVSPASGDEVSGSKVSIRCDANTTYDPRTCTITIQCAELTKTLSVTQATNQGLLVSPSTYDLTNAAQEITLEVKANVQFEVVIDAVCADWITLVSTKGLKANTLVLGISENTEYDGREGKVTIKQKDGALSEAVTVRQSQMDALFVTSSEYELTSEAQTFDIEVKYNVDFDIIIPDECMEWISFVGTKSLTERVHTFAVTRNNSFIEREASIEFKQKNGELNGAVRITQKCEDDYEVAVIHLDKEDNRQTMYLFKNGFYILEQDLKDEGVECYYFNLFGEELSEGLSLYVKNNHLLYSLQGDSRIFFGNLTDDLFDAALFDASGNYGVFWDLPVELSAAQTKAGMTWEIKAKLLLVARFAEMAARSYYLFIPGSPKWNTFSSFLYNRSVNEMTKYYWSNYKQIRDKVTNLEVFKEGTYGIDVEKATLLWDSVFEIMFPIVAIEKGFDEIENKIQEAYDNLNPQKQFDEFFEFKDYHIKMKANGSRISGVSNQFYINCGPEPAVYYVDIETESQWWLESDSEWCSPGKYIGNGHSQVVIAVSKNDDPSSRMTVVEVKSSGRPNAVDASFYSGSILVQQSATDDFFSLSDNSLQFASEGGEREVRVSANAKVDYWYVASFPDWCTIQEKGDSFTISVPPYEGDRSHSGTITVAAIYKENPFAPHYTALKINQLTNSSEELLRAVLTEFYQSTHGDDWYRNDNWCSDDPVESWYGISKTPEGFYTIDLSSNNLSGIVYPLNRPIENHYDELWWTVYQDKFKNNDTWFDEEDRPYVISKVVLNDNPLLGGLIMRGDPVIKELECDFEDNGLWGVWDMKVDLSGCKTLKFFSFNERSAFEFSMPDCPELKEIRGIFESSIVNVSGCLSLEKMELALDSHDFIENWSYEGHKKRGTLNASKCSKLQYLIIHGGTGGLAQSDNTVGNSALSLDLEGCDSLKELTVGNWSGHIGVLDISSAPALHTLYASMLGSNISIIGGPSLKRILLNTHEGPLSYTWHHETFIGAVDITQCRSIEYIQCGTRSINARGCQSLERVVFDETAYKPGECVIDFSDCVSLSEISTQRGGSYHENSLPATPLCNDSGELNLSGCKSLIRLNCTSCHLDKIILKGCSSMEWLKCSDNKLQFIDVSDCPSLAYFDCQNNKLQSIDVSHCPSLSYFHCRDNPLVQQIINEDRIALFFCDYLFDYNVPIWNETTQSWELIPYVKNDYGWYYPGEPEKGYHGR